MPCGGIWPIGPNGLIIDATEIISRKDLACLQCGARGADHFCEEWDGGLHGACIAAYLETEEGMLVVAHGHQVERYDEVLFEGS
jgi:hypothetical protein